MEKIIVLDFGSQYTQLICRKVRELNVYCEILPCETAASHLLKSSNPAEPFIHSQPTARESRIPNPEIKGLILSGGPASVYDKKAPLYDGKIFDLGIPILGICYGLQVMTHLYKGEVKKARKREYGRASLFIDDDSDLFKNIVPSRIPPSPSYTPNPRPGNPESRIPSIPVWMSHGDVVEKLPAGFEPIGHSDNSPYAAIRNRERKFFGIQFHPEVTHTPQGKDVLKNFLYSICQCRGDWTISSFIQRTISQIQEEVGENKVICGLSGGVDSSVTALLLHRAIKDRLIPIFVETGLLRKGEKEIVQEMFSSHRTPHSDISIQTVLAQDRFLKMLSGVTDPEEKRKIIGETFIRVFEEESEKSGGVEYLAQGTLYPDRIESQSVKGPSATIKTHHNVGGLPSNMKFKLIEPLQDLFKDEVREVAQELGLPDELHGRHPFPGPGLAVRILGEVTEERVETLKEADAIYLEEIRNANLYDQIWQAFSVLLPVKSVGVMGDFRSYENVIALRAVTSRDGMTADWFQFPPEVLQRISSRITNEVHGVNRVVYDITSKPPATIEWE
jgi:GMP synthase (glutamine-hydrolysing)